jgi:DNA-binding transcriptional ArsR family regulator
MGQASSRWRYRSRLRDLPARVQCRIVEAAGLAVRYSTNWLTVWLAGSIFNRMVEIQQNARLDAVFHALGDATRRRMLMDLAAGQERSVGELARPFTMSLAAASKHIKVLETAGLIRRKVRGRTHLCRLEPGPLATAHQWLALYERFWTGRLDALEQRLREEDAHRPSPPERKDG